MVFSVMKLFIPVERRAEAVEILTKIQGRLEICTDHLGSWIQERDHPCSHIVYIEHWKSEESIFNHIRSSLYRGVLAVIELSSQTPEVNYFFDSQPEGMKLIEVIRQESHR